MARRWSAKPYNTLRFFAEFTGVTNLRMAGIIAEAERSVRITEGASDGLTVAVVGGGREISFCATASRITHIRVELRGGLQRSSESAFPGTPASRADIV
ncbi:hypothetical protein ACIGFK_19115 [Streptomyces sp. NPDC085524]|uniref:hypothetical protein n=1 Tax=unclassified Streptomyces TaxID=2593676 RepID=UPI0036C1619C